jgi:hypothetical protein
MSNNVFTVYRVDGIQDYILTPKTFGPGSSWKYKNLWFRTFKNKEIAFSMVVEQSDIGYCYIYGESKELTQHLLDLGVKHRGEYEIMSVEGTPEDTSGRLLHLDKDFTLEIKKQEDSYRIKMYPSDYNGMVQKRCLIRNSFAIDPFDVVDKKVIKMYQGPKEDLPEEFKHLLDKPQKSGCFSMLLLGLTLIGALLWML